MGSGKTTVAAYLSSKLNLKLIDMDDLALKKSKRKSINEIFESCGEKKFRELELQVAKEIAEKDDVVISAGGGVVMNKSTMDYLTKDSHVVYLKTSFDQIRQRVELKKIRPPLFKNTAFAKKLFFLREPLYKHFATVVVATDNKKINDIIKEIIIELGSK